MKAQMTTSTRRACRRTAALALAAFSIAVRAHAAEPDESIGARLYAGVGAASARFEDEYEGIGLADTSIGLGLYAGVRLREHLAIELSYEAFDAIDLHDVVGSGIARFDAKTERRSAMLGVLREISLRELFGWRRDWRMFGVAGFYGTDLERTVTLLGSDARSSAADSDSGLFVGAGVIYQLGRVELRGYVRELGALDRGEAREAGGAVQFRF
jgi:opacity protein-like surface antigen